MTLPPEPIPILLAGNAEYAAIAAVRALRAAGYAPWLAVDERGTYAARSRATAGTALVPDPKSDGEGFVREVAAAAARFSVAAVLPGGESYLHALAGRQDDFKGMILGTPSRARVHRATDKALLPDIADAAGLRTPPTVRVSRSDSETVGVYGFPAILKPVRNWIRNPDESASADYYMRYHSVRCVADREEAEQVLKTLPDGEAYVQPHVLGQLVSIVGVSWEGELCCASHQASIRIWPVPCGVSAYAQTIPRNLQLEQGVGRLLRLIGWSGVFQAQFVRNPRGEYYLIDFNPRIYGSLGLAVAAGLNLPGIWADLLLGRQPSIGDYRVGVRFRHEENDLRALVRMLVNGEPRRAFSGAMPRRDTVHAVFSLRDPMPLQTSIERISKRRMMRLHRWLGLLRHTTP